MSNSLIDETTVTLHSSSLTHKWGFDDGNALSDILYGAGYGNAPYRNNHLTFQHEVLARCIEKYLLPLLPLHITVDRIGTCHNPVRVSEEAMKADLSDVKVEVTAKQVLAIAEEVKAEQGL